MGKKSEESEFYDVEAIKGKKKVQGKWLYYVKWEGYSDDNNTWEPIENLEECKSILDEFEKEYSSKKNKKLNKKRLDEANFLPRTSSPKPKAAKVTKEMIPKQKGQTWFSRANNKNKKIDSDAKKDFSSSKKSYSKNEISKSMNYEALDAPVETVNDKNDNPSHLTTKQLSKMSESIPFNLRDPNYDNKYTDNTKDSTYNKNESKTRLCDGLGKIINDPEITDLEIQDHLVVDKEIHFWIVGIDKKGRKKPIGYFKNDVVKFNIPIELCSYYEKFIKFDDH